MFLIVFAAFVFFAPNFLGHPDNYIPANPLVTPAHIVPEWYFLPFYAILRASTPDDKLRAACIAMFGSIADAVLAALARHLAGALAPLPADLQVVLLACCWSTASCSAMCGAHPPEGAWSCIGRASRTLYYFVHFLDPPAAPGHVRAAAAAAAQHRRAVLKATAALQAPSR